MKKIKFGSITLLILTIILVVGCCSNSRENEQKQVLKKSIPIAQCLYGTVSKIEDDDNIIYVYERAGSVTVVKKKGL